MASVLKVLRISKNMTQKQLEMETGIRQDRLSRIETGKAIPKADEMQKLQKALLDESR